MIRLVATKPVPVRPAVSTQFSVADKTLIQNMDKPFTVLPSPHQDKAVGSFTVRMNLSHYFSRGIVQVVVLELRNPAQLETLCLCFLQQSTSEVISSTPQRDSCDRVVFAASDTWHMGHFLPCELRQRRLLNLDALAPLSIGLLTTRSWDRGRGKNG